LIVADTRDEWPRQCDYLRLLSGKTTDGIILVPSMATDEQIASIPVLLRSTPLVYVDRSPLNAQVDSVLVDNVRAAYEATEHLLELGHRRIAIITEPLNLLNAADRLLGYKRALKASRIPVDPVLVRRGDNTPDSGYWHALEIFKPAAAPTAVLVCNNRMLLGLMMALRELRLACPRAVSLVGFDDFDWSPYIDPPLTIVRQPAVQLGESAARILLKRIRHPHREHHEKVLIPTQLVVRQSTARLSFYRNTSRAGGERRVVRQVGTIQPPRVARSKAELQSTQLAPPG